MSSGDVDDAAACPRCGTRVPKGRLEACPRCLLEDETVSLAVHGTLELEEEIGRGGMGVVYRARHRRLGRPVAVKFLPDHLAAQPEFEARFAREARALAMLDHPNIVTIHDFGQEDGASYIVMEYVRGRPLAAAMPLPVERAVAVALDVLDALAYAHARGIVHRDVKPENILIDEATGRVKVGDFGIARMIGPDARGFTVTSADAAPGTPQYMAPEALAGDPPDPRMDLYSVGVVLYRTIAGRVPAGDFEPLPHAELDRVVRRALAPDPARRYATAEEMRRELEAAHVGGGPLTPTLSPPRAPSRAAAGAAGCSPPGGGLGASPGERGRSDLDPVERNWLRAVALLQAVATAVALWAFLVSVRPRVIAPGDVMPLVMIGTEDLPDGRIVSRARFEAGWTIAALATFAAAITAYAFLRRHWQRAGLELAAPDRSVRESRAVLACGLVSCALYGVHLLLRARGRGWPDVYIPVVGGAIEVAALFFAWVAILEAWRRARPLRREPLLWLGFGLAIVPPVTELFRYVRDWRP